MNCYKCNVLSDELLMCFSLVPILCEVVHLSLELTRKPGMQVRRAFIKFAIILGECSSISKQAPTKTIYLFLLFSRYKEYAMEFRLLHLKILLIEKEYNVGIYQKICEGKNLTIISVLYGMYSEKTKNCLVVCMIFQKLMLFEADTVSLLMNILCVVFVLIWPETPKYSYGLKLLDTGLKKNLEIQTSVWK